MFSTIVHPTDFSESTIPALRAAQSLAKTHQAKLLVCFIAHPPLVASGDTLTDPQNGETRDLAAELESLQPAEADVERDLRIVITDQSTRMKTLLGFIEDMQCDLMVLGMHKRTGVAGWFGPSITEEVVRHAGCAVLVVKHLDDEQTADENADQ